MARVGISLLTSSHIDSSQALRQASLTHPLPVDQASHSINVLPPEILSAIFLVLRQVRRERQLLPFQVELSHVCRHWRQTAISTPQLWSTITLFSAKSQLCIEEWLTRSGSVPLDVRLDLYDADFAGEVTVTWLQDSLMPIVSNTHRFRTLLLFTHKEVNAYHVLRLFQHAEAPLLERLRVHIGGHVPLRELTPFASPIFPNGFTLPTAFVGGLPNLAFAELQPLRCIPPITNVTTLHLNVVGSHALLPFNRLVEILQMPHNLVTLSLRGNIAQDGWPLQRDRPHTVFPDLRNLEIASHGASGVLFILFFGAPKLESLRWQVSSDNYHQLLESPQFQTQTYKFPNLKYLTLIGQSFTPHNQRMLTSAFPTPTHILCTHPMAPRQTYRHMESLLNAPCVEVLGLQRIFDPSNELFVRGLRNTLSGHTRLRKVLVDAELLKYLDTHEPRLREVVELDEINAQTFPDYWWSARVLDTPDRL